MLHYKVVLWGFVVPKFVMYSHLHGENTLPHSSIWAICEVFKPIQKDHKAYIGQLQGFAVVAKGGIVS